MALRPSREIAFPFRIGPDGGVAYVESEAKTFSQHVAVTLLTNVGERVMVPTFGTPVNHFLFDNLDDLSAAQLALQVRRALTRWEPSVVILDVQPTVHALEGRLELDVSFSVPPRDEVLSTVVGVGGAVPEDVGDDARG